MHGGKVASLATDAAHRVDTNVAWTRDERYLAGPRKFGDGGAELTYSRCDDRSARVEDGVRSCVRTPPRGRGRSASVPGPARRPQIGMPSQQDQQRA